MPHRRRPPPEAGGPQTEEPEASAPHPNAGGAGNDRVGPGPARGLGGPVPHRAGRGTKGVREAFANVKERCDRSQGHRCGCPPQRAVLGRAAQREQDPGPHLRQAPDEQHPHPARRPGYGGAFPQRHPQGTHHLENQVTIRSGALAPGESTRR